MRRPSFPRRLRGRTCAYRHRFPPCCSPRSCLRGRCWPRPRRPRGLGVPWGPPPPAAAETLGFFARLYRLADRHERIDRALRAVNLLDRANDLCRSLSKGLRQRAALARALLSDPAVLFLDEPTSGLDPVATREVHDLIATLKDRGVTIFLTTHRLEEAERLCHRVAILNTTMRLVGRPDELRAQLFTSSLEVRLRADLADPASVFAAAPGVDRWEAVSSGSYLLTVSDPDAAAPEVARALVHAGADICSLTESRHSLEDVYLELVDEDVEAKRR